MPVRTTKREGAAVEGAVTRTVTDAAALLDAISEPAPFGWWNPPAPVRPFAAEVGVDPGRLRIGVLKQAPFASEPYITWSVGRIRISLTATRRGRVTT